MRIINTTIILIIWLITNQIFSQTWTEPINVSNLTGYDYKSAITIDTNGIIHIVWIHIYSSHYSVVMYSKSSNNGETWTDPTKISNNDSIRCMSPQITVDKFNTLYVSYDFDLNPYATTIQLQFFNGINWTEPIIISENLPGSSENRITVDYNNRLYIFWRNWENNGWKIFYRYLENSLLSDIFCPYTDDNQYILESVIPDSINNLHCCVFFVPYYTDLGRTAYIKYNSNLNSWTSPVLVSNNTILTLGMDIALDTLQQAHIVWPEFILNTNNDTIGTYYSYLLDTIWSTPELISKHKYEMSQSIDINNYNEANIYNSSYINDTSYLLNFRNDNSSWNLITIDTGSKIAHLQNEILNNTRYLTYTKGSGSSIYDEFEIYFTKSDITTGINNNYQLIEENQYYIHIYPNPFFNYFYLDFYTTKTGYYSIKLISSDLITKINLKDNIFLEKGLYTFHFQFGEYKNYAVVHKLYFITILGPKFFYVKKIIHSP